MWIETNPCTEFWFLLHFLPQLSTKHYETYEDVLPDLQHYMPGYEKTVRYFKKNNLYKYLTEHGDLERAIGLKPSRTRDYLKQLVDEGVLEIEGEYKNRKYKIKK